MGSISTVFKGSFLPFFPLNASVPKCKNWKQLLAELQKAGINTEFKYKGNSDEIQGVRFEKNGYLYNGSKIDRMFSYSKIDYQLNMNAKNLNTSQSYSHLTSNAIGSTVESVGSALGGLLNIQPGNGYNADEAEFQRQMQKKKKKRRYGRQM